MSNRKPKTRWVGEVLSSLAVASGVGYIAAAYTISRWLTRPSRGTLHETPSDHGLVWEPVTCQTADRIRLSGWVITPPEPRGTVALFHGIRGNRARTLSRSAFLARAGYRCVAFDHRAHGQSGGKRSSFGYHEARDVAAVLDLVEKRWPGQPSAVLGISMGAAAVCFAAEHVGSARAVVLESLYQDLRSALENRMRSTAYPAWFRRLKRGTVWMTERRLRVRMQDVSPLEHIGRLSVPVFLMTGTDDQHAPPTEAERLLERCRGPRQLWLIPQATHHDVFDRGGSEYQERVLAFLERHLHGVGTDPTTTNLSSVTGGAW